MVNEYLKFIKDSEGIRLEAYLDTKGIPTIGWGSIWLSGRRVVMGDKITQEQADSMLDDYYRKEIEPTINKLPSYITTNQKKALVSLIYNWNANGFLNSKLYQAILRKDKATIIREWDFGFKDNQNGLYTRRIEELALFVPDYKQWK